MGAFDWGMIDSNLDPTIEFFESLVGKEETKDAILTDPTLLGYSLKNRLKPRLLEVEEAGIPIDTGTLRRMGSLTAAKWSASLAFQKKKLLKSRLKDW